MSDPPHGPKDEHSIRKALKAIHKGADTSAPAGPHAGGVSRHHPVLIATFHDLEAVRKFSRVLIQQGIEPDVSQSDNAHQISVDAQDTRRATEIYLKTKDSIGDGRVSRNPARHDLLILSTVIGVMISFILGLALSQMKVVDPRPPAARAWQSVDTGEVAASLKKSQKRARYFGTKATLLVLLLSMMAGYAADRYRMNGRRSTGRKNSFGLWELLFGTAVLFVISSLYQALTILASLVRSY